MSAGNLGAEIDGAALPDDAARALWQRFSAHMEAHQGDLAGFAKAEGFLSARTRVVAGKAVLVLSQTEPQAPYGPVKPTEPPRRVPAKRR